MGYRMPYPIPCLPVVLAAIGASLILPLISHLVGPRIREAHTRTTLSQIDFELKNLNEVSWPRDHSALISFLQTRDIDWNSCEIKGEGLLDGWGRNIETLFDASANAWSFRSAGKDGSLDTRDDIQLTCEIETNGEQVQPPNPR